MPASLTTINNILKELYTSPVVRQLNDEILLLQRLDSSSDEVIMGKYAVVPLSVGRTGGIGARPEFGTLASSGNQRFLQAQYNLSYQYARIGVSGPSIAKSSKDAGAFLRVLKAEIDGATLDLKKDVARQLYGDSTAAIATVNSLTSGGGTATVTLTLTSAEPIDKGQFYVGMNVDIGSLANPVLRNPSSSYGTITTITASSNTLVIASASGGNFGTPANGDLIFRQGNATTSSANYEMTGLRGIVSTSAGVIVGGLNPATAGNEVWENVRATAASVSQDAMQQLWSRVRRTSGDTPSLIVGSYGMRRQYFNTLSPQIRYASSPTKLAGGFEALDFNGLPLVADHECPYGNFYFLNEKHLKIYAINAQGGTDFAWMNLDGDVLLRIANQDGYEAIMHRYMQLGTDMRNAHGVLSGITDTGY